MNTYQKGDFVSQQNSRWLHRELKGRRKARTPERKHDVFAKIKSEPNRETPKQNVIFATCVGSQNSQSRTPITSIRPVLIKKGHPSIREKHGGSLYGYYS